MAETVSDTPTLGDCMLHLTHHGMTRECWQVVMDHYMQVVGGREPGSDHVGLRAEVVNSYKARYERALLNAIRSEAANV